jgi:hypothetical protein
MIFGNFHSGRSLAKSEQDRFFTLKNVDVFSTLGNAKCQYALVSDSTTPNENCIMSVAPSGDVYHFSTESGKIWKQSSGTYSLIHTNANGAHSGCKYFNGRLYYSAGTKLGYFDMSSTWSDSAHTFTKSATFRPMLELENELIIGNGHYIAAVDMTFSFQDNALDLPSQYTVSALSSSGTYVIIGTTQGESIHTCKSYLWDGISNSWSEEDVIPENGVNFFIEVDNGTYAQCGTTGNIYQVSGSRFTLYTNIRETTKWNPYVSSVLDNKAIFGVNEKIFSFHRPTAAFPFAVVNEYTITTGSVEGLATAGTQLYVSTGSNIDKIGTSLAVGVIETPESIGSFIGTRVMYEELGGTIGLEYRANGGSYTGMTEVVNSKKNLVYSDYRVADSNFYQARITLTPTTGNVSIKYIENVSYNDQNIK